jgi:hypothetical protein
MKILHISINLTLVFFSEIKALQEIEDHENVCKTKIEKRNISFL